MMKGMICKPTNNNLLAGNRYPTHASISTFEAKSTSN